MVTFVDTANQRLMINPELVVAIGLEGSGTTGILVAHSINGRAYNFPEKIRNHSQAIAHLNGELEDRAVEYGKSKNHLCGCSSSWLGDNLNVKICTKHFAPYMQGTDGQLAT